MTPIDPTEGTPLEGQKVTLCAEHVCDHTPKHIPLVVLFDPAVGQTVTRWQFSDAERTQVAAGADLYIWQQTTPVNFPPIMPVIGE